MVNLLSFLPRFTHLFTALSQKNTGYASCIPCIFFGEPDSRPRLCGSAANWVRISGESRCLLASIRLDRNSSLGGTLSHTLFFLVELLVAHLRGFATNWVICFFLLFLVCVVYKVITLALLVIFAKFLKTYIHSCLVPLYWIVLKLLHLKKAFDSMFFKDLPKDMLLSWVQL